ncbi:MAG: hypothetical protein COW19_00145 [Zetaproteobacteria bacterium CG12_big_fil_rev_8_21_14_0_65_55_1124]|nr:MAG: hypothetical protein AUJ58_02920 [Zetaproteobacteria bacterium CG1_02_55_237]PIS18725.1 MAG: hypothetical protein COT53_09275 [Zetaproteobacteria bacterium CG08_land_8_20_14_0_20_55_17]PIW43957.1 MAG: hypothetical protein COW19_00145 [Zetaproteobacteria bacterium CG12_big_fil_rev_8_21_14_0_65_55_1124]PIY52452.1 MAG: hypothetical protein COZ01_07590 [Zetaproteobacteria bacterium CG_4_10_14_0_8_um_filter_55_43]PIZ36731.1 MAG: hypothetical protein COY36_11260 [Zetaproteobacteria bacterium 
MESISSIPPSVAIPAVATRQAKSGQSEPHPVVKSVEKAVKPESKQDPVVSEEQLKKALEHVNQQVATEGVGFTYEKRLNQLFVQIKDKATGAVVKEIPPKAVIDQKVAMKEMVGILLDRQA